MATAEPHAASGPPGDSAEGAVLRAFVGHLLGEPPRESWDDLLLPGDPARARAAYFLLHRDPDGGPDAAGFVTRTLERILLQLAARTERELQEMKGRVQGRVVWPRTIKSRLTGDYDPTRYVCRRVRRHFDTPENQLLRFTVERIAECLARVPPALRGGVCYHPDGGRSPAAGSPSIAAGIDGQLREMEAVLPRLRASPRLCAVTLPEEVNAEHVLRARASTLEEYGLVATLHERLAAAMDPGSWRGVVRLGRQSLPLPGRVTPETEPWIRLAAAIHQRAR